MNSHVLQMFSDCDILVMSAAVGDFAPKRIEKEKIKKKANAYLDIQLLPTEDILMNVAAKKVSQLIIGFAAESENLEQSALEKLQNKKLDFIVANDISSPGIGFQSDSNKVIIINKYKNIKSLPILPKIEIANLLLDDIRKSITSNLKAIN